MPDFRSRNRFAGQAATATIRHAAQAATAASSRGAQKHHKRHSAPHAEEPMVCMTHRWRGESAANPSLKPKFPVSRENTGNFIDSGLGSASTAAKNDIKPESYGQIPYASEQGIFCGVTGNLNRRSGKFHALIRESRSRPLLGRPIRSSRDLERCQEAKEDAARCSRRRIRSLGRSRLGLGAPVCGNRSPSARRRARHPGLRAGRRGSRRARPDAPSSK